MHTRVWIDVIGMCIITGFTCQTVADLHNRKINFQFAPKAFRTIHDLMLSGF